jgi:hypothetical protein
MMRWTTVVACGAVLTMGGAVLAQPASGGKPAAAASASVGAAVASAVASAASAAGSVAPVGSAGPAAGSVVGASASPPPPPAGSSVPPASGPGAAPAPSVDGATYVVRLRDLEERIDLLKDQIRRSHTRLSLLSDTVLSGGGAGSRATVKFENQLSGAFKITRLLIVLDGAVQYNKTDQTGAISDQSEIPVYSGSVPTGDHTLQVLVNLQGSGYGVFSYLRGYRFEVRSSHSFTAVDGKTTQLSAIAYEKGGLTTAIEERPAVRYSEKTVAGLTEAGQANGTPNK